MSAPEALPGTWGRRKLPRSCIESTCHAIQRIAENAWKTWASSSTTTNGPGVWAAFGNRLICISRVSDLADHLTGVTDFDPKLLGGESVAAVMRAGRGLILANASSGNQKYNMHLGAVIHAEDGKFLITDMSEEGAVNNASITALVFEASDLVAGFRGSDYGDAAVFKVGLLVCDLDPAFAKLKEAGLKMFDE
jgi:hypothetical protein